MCRAYTQGVFGRTLGVFRYFVLWFARFWCVWHRSTGFRDGQYVWGLEPGRGLEGGWGFGEVFSLFSGLGGSGSWLVYEFQIFRIFRYVEVRGGLVDL